MAAVQEILGTYSPEDLIITISNAFFSHSITGYADGTFVNVTRLVPPSTLYTGSDNTNARVVRANKGSTITITLHQASESNDILSQALIMDESTRDGTWCFNILVKDGTGRSLYFSPQAFIATNPEASFGAEIGTRAWDIQCVSLSNYTGGNGKLTDDAYRTLQSMGVTVDPRWAPA
jgi:hypothetical protein